MYIYMYIYIYTNKPQKPACKWENHQQMYIVYQWGGLPCHAMIYNEIQWEV